jgi:uncharacterized iron-regulated protein
MLHWPFRAFAAGSAGVVFELVIGLMIIAGLAACVTAPAHDVRVLIFGEQHDQPDQQRQVAEAVRDLAARQQLQAVVIEMADRGHGTAGLPAQADEATVQQALAWNDAGWPWAAYGPIVMAAVRAGVPVLGGNLPRASMRESMADVRLDDTVPASVRERLTLAVREGHCNLLPASQEPGMLRIQIARDLSMAQVVREALQGAPGGKQVLLHAGAQHASRDRGVPLHLTAPGGLPAEAVRVVMFEPDGARLQSDERRKAESTPQADHCKELREKLGPVSAAE